jgi:hypothetical protein
LENQFGFLENQFGFLENQFGFLENQFGSEGNWFAPGRRSFGGLGAGDTRCLGVLMGRDALAT